MVTCLIQPHLKYTSTFFQNSRSFFKLKCTFFFPVLVKGLYQTESYSLLVNTPAKLFIKLPSQTSYTLV